MNFGLKRTVVLVVTFTIANDKRVLFDVSLPDTVNEDG